MTSIKLPSPVPPSVSPIPSYARSRLSRQIHPPRKADEDVVAVSVEPEVEEDADDETLYCFCHKQSHGDVSGKQQLRPYIYG